METIRPKPIVRPAHCPKCTASLIADQPFCPRCHLDIDYGTPNQVKKGNCIYCKKNCRYSREHVYGRWLKEQFPSEFKWVTQTLARPGQFPGARSAEPLHSRLIQHQGGHFDQVVMNVCEKCNGVWMSQLHNDAKQLVIEIATGTFRPYTAEERDVLARWVVMVTVNVQCRTRQLTIDQMQRTALMNGVIPQGWSIYAATMNTNKYSGRNFNLPMVVSMASGEYILLATCYFLIGQAAFFTFSSVDDIQLDAALTRSGANKLHIPFRRISPQPSTEALDLGFNLSLDEVESVHKSFPRVAELLMRR